MDNREVEDIVSDEFESQVEDTKTFTQKELDNIVYERLQVEKEKYSQLENEYKDFKFDVEFKEEMNTHKNIIPKNAQDTLKMLKKKLNDEEYLEAKQSIINAYLVGKTPKLSTGVKDIKYKNSFEEALKQRRS